MPTHYKLQTHRRFDGTEMVYMVANMPDGQRYRPGYVNSVSANPHKDGTWSVNYTDGYKTQGLGHYPTKEVAIAAMEHALDHGAGGGYTSRFEPNIAPNVEPNQATPKTT